MGQTFSNLQRKSIRDALQAKRLDVLVIGGGATGAGILLDATVRGMNVALVDMQDFAAGTSSRSTKLVHGGLRYLKQFEIRLVAEVGKERAIVYENGPHVTAPEWMLLPIVKGGTYGKIASSIGIRLYDYLAGVKKSERRQMLTLRETLEAEPLLNSEILKGAGRYVEYRTDDARLTLEIIKEAVNRGGLALNYTKVTKLLYENRKVIGAEVFDVLTEKTYPIYARKVINATGPWVDSLRELDHSKEGKTLHLTKGVHIVVDSFKFPLKGPVYFDVPDGRMIFAVPRDGKVYIGTTDTNYKQDLAHPRMTKEDLQYLVAATNYMFPSLKLVDEDVESSWAGVRPLIHEEGKGPSEISRKDEIFHADSGLITIAGGKLTGYRKMAEHVINLVGEELAHESGRAYPPCTTDSVVISGGHVEGGKGFTNFVARHVKSGVELGLTAEEATRLVRRYGSNIGAIFEIVKLRREEAIAAGLEPSVFAALRYGVDHEMVYSPEDFFTRRTSSTYFRIDWARQWKSAVTHYLGQTFGWDAVEEARQLTNFEERLEEATNPVDVGARREN